MDKNVVIKAAVIVVTVILTMCSATLCYLDLDGAVEVKDAPHMLRIEDMMSSYGHTSRGKWNHINGIGSLGDADENEVGELIDPELVPANENEDGAGETEGTDGEPDPDFPVWEHSGEYDPSIDILILVNKENPVDESYVPADLEKLDYCAPGRSPEWQVMTREAADAFNKMAEDALAEGHELAVTTAYRSYNFQSYLYNSYVESDGQAAADTYSARPGNSEHQTGLAADVSSASVNYNLTRSFGDTEEGKWLAENCYKYGFILRYQKDTEDITGYIYEPWHVRYVGQKAAKEIWEAGVTLEEYLGRMPSWLADDAGGSLEE